MRNPTITLTNLYDSWLTQNSKWLPSKPAEILVNSEFKMAVLENSRKHINWPMGNEMMMF